MATKRTYTEAQRKRINAQKKEYYKANREWIAEKDKIKTASLTNSFYTMYYLPEEHYIGITNQPEIRMIGQRKEGRNTEGWEVVYTFKTKREALDMERKFHDVLGYFGGNSRYKGLIRD